MINAMTNSAWTLLKHTAGSANKAAGKLDQAMYGPYQEVPKPPPRTLTPLEGFGYGLFVVAAIVMFFAWLFKWQGRVDRLKTKVFGDDR